MKKKFDIVIIGGGPAGIVTSITAKKYYPDKNILIIKREKKSVIPCGIPYMISSLKSPDENELSFKKIEDMGINVIVDEVEKIDKKGKEIKTKNGDYYSYGKLILATGAVPIKPSIKGIEKDGIFLIKKDMEYLKNMVERIRKSKKIIVIGGGFIGVEIADEISRLGDKEVYIVEMLQEILPNSFDREFSSLAEEKLKNQKVEIITGVKVEEFIGNEKVEKVRLSNGKVIDTEVVILGIGAKPNCELAKDAGLEITKKGYIWVDEYMRTSEPDIFAVGDCALKRDFFTRKEIPVMLASIATAEGRIAGANLYQLKVIRENKGTVGIYSTYVGGLVLGCAGLTEKNARKEKFEIIVGNFEGVDKHPAKLPDANKIKVKLIFSKHSGIILGGQVAGGNSCGELINTIGISIQKRVSFCELETLQFATHPYLTPAPTMYSLVLAAQDAAGKFVKERFS